MNKKRALFLLVGYSLAAFFLIAVLVVGLRSDHFGLDVLKDVAQGKVDLGAGSSEYEYTFDTKEYTVTGLDIQWINGTVTVVAGSGDKILVKETSNKKLGKEEQLDLSFSNGTVKIKWRNELISFSLFQNTYKNLTVEVPRAVAGDLKSLSCANTSGDVVVSGFRAKKTQISSASGDISLSGLSGEEAKLSCASGDIKADDVSLAETLSCSTASGDVSLHGFQAEKLELDTASGDAFCHGRAEELKASTVSGQVHAEMESAPKKAELDSVSGELTLSVPENEGFDLEYNSISGGFQTDFSIPEGTPGKSGRAIYGKGTSKFTFSTTSGSMKIKKLQ